MQLIPAEVRQAAVAVQPAIYLKDNVRKTAPEPLPAPLALPNPDPARPREGNRCP